MKVPFSRTIKKFWHNVNRRGIILMYHRVCDVQDGFDPWRLCVSLKNFEEQLRILKKYTQLVPLQDIQGDPKELAWGGKNAAITFDDGYADNFHHARPILERYGVPATFFVVSGTIKDRKEFWWDELCRVLLRSGKLPDSFSMTIAGIKYAWRVSSRDDKGKHAGDFSGLPENGSEVSRRELYYVLWHLLRPVSQTKRSEYMQQILGWAGKFSQPEPADLSMTVDELRSLADNKLFEVGAHTVHHPKLTSLTQDEQKEEILGSKQDLEQLLQKPINSFSYPFGDRSAETDSIVASLKYRRACTVVPEPVMRKSNPYTLPRFNVQNWEGPEFERYLLKWLTY